LPTTASRLATGTKDGEPGLVTFSTTTAMAFLEAVSFQEGVGIWLGKANRRQMRGLEE
jgi:hypothetical protein